jgi:hypothetical protein
MKTNQSYFPVSLRAGEVEADVLSLLYDPQTSGGLLASVAAQRAEEVAQAFAARGVPRGAYRPRRGALGRARGPRVAVAPHGGGGQEVAALGRGMI